MVCGTNAECACPIVSEELIPITIPGEGMVPNLDSVQQDRVDRRQEHAMPARAWAIDVGYQRASGGFVSSAFKLLAESYIAVNHHPNRLGLDPDISCTHRDDLLNTVHGRHHDLCLHKSQ